MQVARGIRVYRGSITYSSRRSMEKALCGFNMSGVALADHSDSSKPKKGKRLRKQERKRLVEKFVHKYRASNSGKFPTIKLTTKEVGGSYYVIREIIQEMEYKYKHNQLNNVADYDLESVDIQYTEEEDQRQAVVGAEKLPSYDTGPGISGEDSNMPETVDHEIDTDMHESVPSHKVLTSCHPAREAQRDDLSLVDKHKLDQATEANKDSCLDDRRVDTSAAIEFSSISSESQAVENAISADEAVSDERFSLHTKPKNSISGIQDAGDKFNGTPKELQSIDDREWEHSLDLPKDLQKENLHREPPTESPQPPPPKRKTLWGSFMDLADGLVNFWRKK